MQISFKPSVFPTYSTAHRQKDPSEPFVIPPSFCTNVVVQKTEKKMFLKKPGIIATLFVAAYVIVNPSETRSHSPPASDAEYPAAFLSLEPYRWTLGVPDIEAVHRSTTRLDHLVSSEAYSLLAKVGPEKYATGANHFNGATPFIPPEGWKGRGCGLGPPPDRVGLVDVGAHCRAFIEAYDRECMPRRAGMMQVNVSDNHPAHVHHPLCVSPAVAGKPVYVLVGAIESHNSSAKSCGSLGDTYDILDIRVDSPSTIETALEYIPDLGRKWLKIVAFRPIEVGEYTVRVRTHAIHVQNPQHFVRRKRRESLAQLPIWRCPLGKCIKRRRDGVYKSSYLCLSRPVKVNVIPGECAVSPIEALPPCHATFPTREEDWWGRWVRECTTDATCAAHPVPLRPMEAVLHKSKNLALMRSASSCSMSNPTSHVTKLFSQETWRPKGGGWVWHPHTCRPRMFTPEKAWSCLNGQGLVGIGDSVSTTNGHLMYGFLGMKSELKDGPDFKFSERGRRTDELFGDVTQDRDILNTSAPTASLFYATLTRQFFYHLESITKDVEDVRKLGQDKNPIKTVIVSMGLHDTVRAYSPQKPSDYIESFTKGFVNNPLKQAVIYTPATSCVVHKMCTRKNPHRAQQTNSAYSSALRHLSSQGLMAPVAITPAFFMARSVNWEVPSMDEAGSHPYCSFVGLSMQNQALDLMCKPSPDDVFATSRPSLQDGETRAPPPARKPPPPRPRKRIKRKR